MNFYEFLKGKKSFLENFSNFKLVDDSCHNNLKWGTLSHMSWGNHKAVLTFPPFCPPSLNILYMSLKVLAKC